MHNNCMHPFRRAAHACTLITPTTARAVQNEVGRYMILNGQYSDFSPAWYEEVGLSILVSKLVITPWQEDNGYVQLANPGKQSPANEN